MSDDRKDLPPPNAPNFNERVREALSIYLGKRGDPMDRGITVRDLADAGLIALSPTYLSRPGSSRPVYGPGPNIGTGGGGTVELDYTPPPTPSGLTVTATFANLIITHADPIYAQGHLRTVVYGAIYSGSGPLPTFTDAEVITEFTGTVYAHPVSLGQRWHIWIKWMSKAEVQSALPAGGTNGVAATVGKIGHSDLGPLIVEADNLADGTVTAAKVAAGAVDLTKFANGIEPVTIITAGALPTAFVTKTIFWTDGKLYRWTGTAYTKAVDGADIVANSITAGQIAAGAIGANQIAAGAITTGKLLVTGQGAALNADPAFKDPSAWSVGGPPGSFVTISDGASGATAYRSAVGAETDIYGTWGPADPTKSYRVRCQARHVGSNGRLYIGCQFLDGSGANIEGNGSFWYVGAVNSTPGTSWTLYSGIIGQGGPIGTVPANAKTMRVLALINYGATAGYMEVQDLRVEEAIGADLIVDGAIVAGKLSAGAIAVGSAAIADGAIRNALIENAAIDNAKIANVSAAKLTAGSIAVGQHIQSSNYVAGASGWRVNGDGFAEFGAASIRGQLTASQINANGLTIRKPDGSIVLDASGTGTPIHYSSVMPDGGWLNNAISIGANGALSGAGGGQVTLPGMGQHSYRIYCFGYQVQLNGTATASPGIYVDGATSPAASAGSYKVIVISRATGLIVDTPGFHILGGGTAPADMAAYLNALDSTKIVAIFTDDEPQSNRMSGGLPEAMYRCGASRVVFGSSQFQFRSAYILIGIPGSGEGNGAEFYQGSVSSDPNAWCDASFTVLNGNLTGVSSSYTPRSLTDYGYTGDLDATKGAAWGSNLAGRPANLAGLTGSEGIKNGDITVSNSGGAYTINGIGSSGSIDLAGLNAGAMAYLNSITSANVSTYIASAAIDYTRIGVLQAQNLSVVALSNTINGGVTSTGRVEVTSNRVDVYDNANQLRVRLGEL